MNFFLLKTGNEYTRFQAKYILWIVVCSVLLLLILFSDFTLLPYIQKLQKEAFIIYPSVLYHTSRSIMINITLPVLILSSISLWKPIILLKHIRNSILALGILFSLSMLSLILILSVACFSSFNLTQHLIISQILQFWISAKALQIVVPLFTGMLLFFGLNR